MSRTISLIVLALVTAAVAVPIASSGTTPVASCSQADNPSGCYQGKPFVDPLGASYQTIAQAHTIGSCSQADNPSGCYQGKPFVDPLGSSYQALARTRIAGDTSTKPFVDPLAVSYLGQMGLTPAQIKDWTVGVCAQAQKPAVCFAPFQQASASTPTATSSSGFEWSDASIGAAAMLGAVLLLGGLGAILVTSRHGRRRTIASA